MPIAPKEALQRAIEHREIFFDEMRELMRAIMAGEVSPVMTAALLVALRVKKETVGEIAAAASVMRELAAPITLSDAPQPLLDIVGTGGDGAHSVNISTAASFVAAAAGARVAKHGNRGVSSQSGSADVLEALGVRIDLPPALVARCLDEVGMGFLFAPIFHPAMKQVAPIRREMGVRTIFNILGPLTNPAHAPNTLMGVFHADLVGIQVRVMQRLGAERVLVVYGTDGLDEISLGAPTLAAEWRDGQLREFTLDAKDFGFARTPREALQVSSAQQSRDAILAALANAPGAARDAIALNAGVAIYVAGLAADMAQGIERAHSLIASGAARAKLQAFAEITQQLAAQA